jgi:hypothetical protein
MRPCLVTYHLSLTVLSHARQLYIQTNRTTAASASSVINISIFGRFFADRSIKNMTLEVIDRTLKRYVVRYKRIAAKDRK